MKQKRMKSNKEKGKQDHDPRSVIKRMADKLVDMNLKVARADRQMVKLQATLRDMTIKEFVMAAIDHYLESFPIGKDAALAAPGKKVPTH